jgi:heme-degrading monooxygenase HmoA
MFSVLFEVRPKAEQWNAYLDNAKRLRPVLEKVEGFVDNIRYRSLTREGWILSLSNWKDEKALVRWRTNAEHHAVQAKGRFEILEDYHLRVGQVTVDTRLPAGYALLEQRLDETEAGAGTAVTLIDAGRAKAVAEDFSAEDLARSLGLDGGAPGLQSWDVFDAVLTPGTPILLMSWRDPGSAEAFEKRASLPAALRLRRVRIIRDYGMDDRREAPQYYPEVSALRGNV